VRRKRRAAPNEVAPGHGAGMLAKPQSGRFAWRKFDEIDSACARRPNAEQQAHRDHHDFHVETRPHIFVWSVLRNPKAGAKSSDFVRRLIGAIDLEAAPPLQDTGNAR